jgi:hypothetical protein
MALRDSSRKQSVSEPETIASVTKTVVSEPETIVSESSTIDSECAQLTSFLAFPKVVAGALSAVLPSSSICPAAELE